MRNVIGSVVVCSTLVVGAGGAAAAPRGGAVTPQPPLKAATALSGAGKYAQALDVIEAGLAKEPNNKELLQLKGSVLIQLRDIDGAIAAYQAYIAAGATGANKRDAETILKNLGTAPVVDITLSNGPADIYLDSKNLGVLCNAAPTCHKKIMPGVHKVIVERPGFQPVSQRVTLAASTPAQIAIAMTEEPSLVTLHLPTDVQVQAKIDDAPYTGPVKVAGGSHHVVVTAPGHVDTRLEAVAHEGKPIDLEVGLTPLVPLSVQPAGATVTLDGAPVVTQDGGIALPKGAHKLIVRAPGYRDRATDIPAEVPAGYTVTIALDRIPPPAPPSSGMFTTRRKIAVGVGGVAVAAVVVGAILGKQSKDKDHDAYALCPDPDMPCASATQADDLNKQGRDRATQANIAFGVAGAGAVAAAVLWLTGAPESITVAPHAGPGSVAGLDVGFKF